MMMNKLIFVTTLIALSTALMYPNRPDSIRCGADNSCCDGATFIYHSAGPSTIGYHQVYSGQVRGIYFNPDGSYSSSSGHYDSRKGCENKSLSQLDKQGRTFYFADDRSVNEKIIQLKNQIQTLKQKQMPANFWDYELIKEKWLKQFKKDVRADIKNNGLQIGRWILNQESTFFAIRDVEGSKTKDSRIAFPANSYIDPR